MKVATKYIIADSGATTGCANETALPKQPLTHLARRRAYWRCRTNTCKTKCCAKTRAPDPPSDERRQLDELTHADFAPWCPHCVAGKAPEDQHARRNKHEDPEIPVIQLDFQHNPVPDTATKPRTEQKMPIGSKDGGHGADMVERTSRQIPKKSNLHWTSITMLCLGCAVESIRPL